MRVQLRVQQRSMSSLNLLLADPRMEKCTYAHLKKFLRGQLDATKKEIKEALLDANNKGALIQLAVSYSVDLAPCLNECGGELQSARSKKLLPVGSSHAGAVSSRRIERAKARGKRPMEQPGAHSFAGDRTTTAPQLAEWLKRRGLDVDAWGQGAAKGVGSLLQELVKQESTLDEVAGRVLRCVSVAKLRIMRPGSNQFLIEAKQVLPDGRERVRNDVPGEKMYAGEGHAAAALRGASEELCMSVPLDPSDVMLLHETVEVKPSASYPNLMSRYTFYEVGMVIPGLPTSSFETTEKQGDVGVVHHWEWHDAMIQPQGSLSLTPTQTRLLERMFAGCACVEVSTLHGGFSGSMVLKTVSFDSAGARGEPTVTKIDRANDILREVKSTNFVARAGADVRATRDSNLGVTARCDSKPVRESSAHL